MKKKNRMRREVKVRGTVRVNKKTGDEREMRPKDTTLSQSRRVKFSTVLDLTKAK